MNTIWNKTASIFILICISAFSLSCFIFDRPTDHYKTGNELYSEKQWDKAIDEYTKAISMDSNQPFFYINRALSYNQIGEYDLAIADCSKAIAKKHDIALAYTTRASAYNEKGLYLLALADSEKAIELNPKLALGYINKG
ncbi:MAG: tetratricopeptide repeat protein, partial [Dehalococcoidia bacterium]